MVCQAVTGGGRKEGCHPLPSGTTPRAEAGTGKAAVTGPSAGIKPATPSLGHGEAEPLHCRVSAKPGVLCKQAKQSKLAEFYLI